MRINDYLLKIEQGKPLDLLVFKNYLRSLNLAVAHQIDALQARQVKPGKHVVTHVPPALQQALAAYAEASLESRVVAARQNRSHAVSVSGSMLVVRRESAHPQLVVFDAHGQATVPFSCAPYALIIENLENFLRIEQTLQFLQRDCGFSATQLAATDIIFASGKQVTNRLHANFLRGYQQVDLLLDFDLGGFEIAASLCSMLASIPTRFILPNDIERRLATIQTAIAHDDLQKIVTLAKAHQQLIEPATIMKTYQRVLEQETYLE